MQWRLNWANYEIIDKLFHYYLQGYKGLPGVRGQVGIPGPMVCE